MDHSDYTDTHITKPLSSSTMVKEQHSESHLDLPLEILIRPLRTAGLNLSAILLNLSNFAAES